MQHSFGIGNTLGNLGTSLAILGYAQGVMLWSPHSEAVRIGGKPIYIETLLIFVAIQIPVVLETNISMLFVFRFLSGGFGAPVLSIGGASIDNMYTAFKRGFAIVLWDLISIGTPGKCSAQSLSW